MAKDWKNTPVLATSVVVDQYQIVKSLQSQLPCGDPQDFQAFAERLCDGENRTTLDKILLNVFIDTPIGYTVAEEGNSEKVQLTAAP